MSGADVLKMIKDKKAKFVDFRFTDTKGKEQHVSVPASTVDASLFEDGKMFDGSSIAGWKGIQESDMILMPDPSTAMMDPFMEEPTLILRCDVVEPSTMQGYERCPRSLAKRAEAYLKSTGVADTAFFGPEAEFFILDDVRWGADMSGSFVKIDSEEASWNTEKVYEGGNLGHRPGIKGGYFPVPPVDSQQDIRSAMCLAMEDMGLKIETHHHEVATAGQNEIGMLFNTLVKKGRRTANLQVLRAQRRAQLRQDRDLHAQADRRRQRFRHARAPVAGEGRQEPVQRQRVRRPVADGDLLHRRHHQACARVERHHQLAHQLL